MLNHTFHKVLYAAVMTWAVAMGGGCGVYELHRAQDFARRDDLHDTAKESAVELPTHHGRLSLSDAVAMAIQYSPVLRSAREDVRRAEGIRWQAWSRSLPKMGLQASYTQLEDIQKFEFMGQSFSMGERENYSAAVALQHTLFASGSNLAALRGSRAYQEATEAIVEATRQMVIAETRKAYYDVLLARELVEVSEQALGLARSHLDDIEKRFREGVASEFDRLRAKVEVANVEAEAIRARNLLRLARAQLANSMGVSQNSDFELSDALSYEPVPVDLDAAQERALERRPDLRAVALQVEVERQRLVMARADALPRVELTALDSYSKPGWSSSFGGVLGGGGDGSSWERNRTLTVALQVPIFDAFSTHGKVFEQEAALRKAQLQLLERTEAALLEVQQAVLTIQDTEKFVESQRANVEQAEEALRLADVGYKAGVNRLIEVQDARTALTAARQNYWRAVHAHMSAVLALEAATGSVTASHAHDSGEQEK